MPLRLHVARTSQRPRLTDSPTTIFRLHGGFAKFNGTVLPPVLRATEEQLAKSKAMLSQLTDIELLAHTRAIQNRLQTEFTEEERNRFAESSYITANTTPRQIRLYAIVAMEKLAHEELRRREARNPINIAKKMHASTVVKAQTDAESLSNDELRAFLRIIQQTLTEKERKSNPLTLLANPARSERDQEVAAMLTMEPIFQAELR